MVAGGLTKLLYADNVEFKIRQRERVQNRKTRKADIDKIINS